MARLRERGSGLVAQARTTEHLAAAGGSVSRVCVARRGRLSTSEAMLDDLFKEGSRSHRLFDVLANADRPLGSEEIAATVGADAMAAHWLLKDLRSRGVAVYRYRDPHGTSPTASVYSLRPVEGLVEWIEPAERGRVIGRDHAPDGATADGAVASWACRAGPGSACISEASGLERRRLRTPCCLEGAFMGGRRWLPASRMWRSGRACRSQPCRVRCEASRTSRSPPVSGCWMR